MATSKEAAKKGEKKAQLRDLPKKNRLTKEQAAAVKAGIATADSYLKKT
jgi:hypothetical protein